MPVASITALLLASRQKANMELDDQLITDAELTGYVNQSIRDLYDVVVDHGDHSWLPWTEQTLTAGANGVYTIPAPAYKFVAMWIDDGGKRRPIRPCNPRDAYKSIGQEFTPARCKYIVNGRALGGTAGLQVETYPYAPSGQPAIFRTISEPTVLVSGADSLYFPNGWDEYVVTDAAIKCLEKEESDTRALMARREMLRQRIIGASATLDRGEPRSVTDVTDRIFPYFARDIDDE